MTRAARRLNPQFLFLGLAAGINILVMVLARNAASPRSHAVAVGAVLDMTVTVPALYYWLVVRPGLRNMASLGLIVMLSLWRAAFSFPAIVPGKAWIGAAVECLVVVAVVLGIRRARREAGSVAETDPVARIHTALQGIFPWSAIERAVAGELAVLYYGLAWRAKPDLGKQTHQFSLHRRSALRFGLLAQLRIPVSAIRRVTREIPAGSIVMPRRTAPELYIEFNRPLEIEKLPGFRQTIGGIAVSADQSAEFAAAIDSVCPMQA